MNFMNTPVNKYINEDNNYNKFIIILILFAGIFFIWGLGNVNLFDWDEINFAEAAREMIIINDYLNVRIDFEPFHEKPPLYIWFQVISMKIFGINEFAARLPNAIIGIITLFFLAKIGTLLYDKKFGFLWTLAYFGSFLPHFYFKTNIIDPLFNLFMYSAVYYLFRFHIEYLENKEYKIKNIIIAAFLTSLAFMTKGPVGFLIVFLTWAVFWLFNTKSYKFPFKHIIYFIIVSFLPAIIWYTIIFYQSGGGLIGEFITYQIRLLTTGDAGHSGPFYYHFIVVMIGCFPASIFIFQSFRKKSDDSIQQNTFKMFNLIILSVVLILFSIVKTKIVHYSSLSYFPVTFLSAYVLHKALNNQLKISRIANISTAILGIIFSTAFIAFPLVLMNIQKFLSKISDELSKEVLKANVQWSGFEPAAGVVLFIGILLFIYFIFIKKEYLKSYLSIFTSSALTILIFLPLMAPKIESYTQRAAIDFYKSLKGKDIYVHTLGYKSYAPYFYHQKELKNSKYYLKMNNTEYEQYLLFGHIDKPAYFSVHINNYDDYIVKQPDLKKLYSKNGFVFLRRNPVR